MTLRTLWVRTLADIEEYLRLGAIDEATAEALREQHDPERRRKREAEKAKARNPDAEN